MKKIVKFSINDEIPDNAKFIYFENHSNKHLRGFYYEVPIKEQVDKPVQDKHIDTIKLIIDYLNEKAGSKYTYKSKATTKLIRARINEGRTYADFKRVIDIKCAEWLDNPNFNQYLRPVTLFGPKFDGYLSQKSIIDIQDAPFKELDKIMERHA